MRVTANGCAMHVSVRGADGPALVFLHYFAGSSRTWDEVVARLEGEYRCIAVDLRGFGDSAGPPDGYTVADGADDVAALVEQLALDRYALVGHSMGGKAAMLVALRRPDLVDRLVVVDVAPVAYESGFGAYTEAMAEADLDGVTRRAEVDAQLASAVPAPGVRAFLLQNLVLDRDGARWRVNLPVLEVAMSTISGFPAVAAGTSYNGPALFVAGGRSDYVRREHADAVMALFPRAEVTVVPEAGHWVHAERLEDFLGVLEPFLAAR